MSERRKVLYLTGNDVLSDARVLKYIHSATQLGFDVRAIGVTRKGPSYETNFGECRIAVVGVPQGWQHRARNAGAQLRTVARLTYPTKADVFAARSQVARWKSSARSGNPVKRGIFYTAGVAGALVVKSVNAWSVRTQSPSIDHGYDEREHGSRVDELIRSGRVDWRRDLPALVRDEARIGPHIDAWAPDIVHVHDVFMIATGAHAKQRAAAAGRDLAFIYDAHESVRGLANLAPELTAAYATLEAEFIHTADRVITVSTPLAERLAAEYNLDELPTVVLNAPITDPDEGALPTLRSTVGVDADPLLVYAGGVNVTRGVDTAVRALPQLPGVHLAIVTNAVNVVVSSLMELARDLGVDDRVHLADYVDPRHVVHYVASASVGLSTLLHSPNHDVAVTNKFCEYVQASLPIITSDTPAQAALVEEFRLGATYPAGDADGFAEAVNSILRDRDAISERMAGDAVLRYRFSWSAQHAVIATTYAALGS